jgi:hypothetical protein
MKNSTSRKLDLIVVLGMHRSGTSAITRGLEVMGVDLGQNLIKPDFDNIKGFWEDFDVIELNQKLLKQLDLDYDHISSVTDTQVQNLCESGFLLEASTLIREKITSGIPYGIKDPRITKLIPFWKKVFEHCELNVGYVMGCCLMVGASSDRESSWGRVS